MSFKVFRSVHTFMFRLIFIIPVSRRVDTCLTLLPTDRYEDNGDDAGGGVSKYH